jgi:hypothetical protein
MTREEYAALEAKYQRLLAEPLPRVTPKPKPTPVLSLPVSDKIADAAKGNPASVRVSARGEDGIAVVEGPRHNPHNVTVRVDWVRQVGPDGRPIYEGAGVVHEYNPIERGLR